MLKKKLKSKEKLTNLFKQLNIKKNDNLIFHSNLAGLHQFERKLEKKTCNYFLKFILNYIGKNGTLLIPTYNYDFTKGKPYSRKNSTSQVGLFGNILLKKFYRFRTFDPIFSHLVFGKMKKEILSCKYDEVFGEKSVFNELQKKNFKIVSFCCSPQSITFLHYIEKKLNVHYRYNKVFEGVSEKKKMKIKYYVGKKNVDYSIKEKKILKLINKKQFREILFGRFKVYVVNANYLFNILKKIISSNKDYLIR